MEDLILLRIGARFKKWECCTSILPKCQAHLQTSSQHQKKKMKKKPNSEEKNGKVARE
jgi:hypothetical protein